MINDMKTVLRKFNLVLVFGLAALFLVSCDGTTTIYGIEHSNHKKGKYKKYPKYDGRYEDHRGKPPGQHKKMLGDKSAKKYSQGHQNKYYKKGKKHHKHDD